MGKRSLNDSWVALLEKELEDSRQQTSPPVQHFQLEEPREVRYLRFQVKEHWGKGGGLQYFAAETGDCQCKFLFAGPEESRGQGFSTVFSLKERRKIYRDSLLTTLPTLGKEWSVSIDYKSEDNRPGDWTSVFRMTTGENKKDYGSRIAFIHPDAQGKIFICSPIDGMWNHHKNFPSLTIGQWTNIEMSQRLHENKHMYTIKIGGLKVFEMENQQPQEFSNVKDFASDPWYIAQPGEIRNLTIKTSTQSSNTAWSSTTTTPSPFISTTQPINLGWKINFC